MESFYGGKQGRSYKIVQHFDSIYQMWENFNEGGSYTDVGYDEYVIIDTIVNNNERTNTENGLLYRRGYNYSERFNPADVVLDDNNTLNINATITTTLTQNNKTVTNATVPKYKNYTYTIFDTVDPVTNQYEYELEITGVNEIWQNAWKSFVTHPGGGAEYIGQIVGPTGDSPAIELLSWSNFKTIEQNAEQIKGHIVVTPRPGYDAAAANTEGYDEYGFHDEIQYGYYTIRDNEDNITGAYLAFDIPYTVFKFEAHGISAYPPSGLVPINGIYTDSTTGITYHYNTSTGLWEYDNLVSENNDSIDHKYYKHYDIKVPKGVHGKDIDNLSIDTYSNTGEVGGDGQFLTYQYKDYSQVENPSASTKIKLSPYKVISNITKVYHNGTYNYEDNDSAYRYAEQLRIQYTYGDPTIVEYQVIERVWLQESDVWAEDADETIDDPELEAGHVYILLSSGDIIDTGILKKITEVSKDTTNGKYYTYYNDNTRTELPIAEIDKIAFDGDLFLIRFKNVEGAAAANLSQTYPYNGEDWINLGSLIKGNHVLTSFTTLEALQTAYPYGFGMKADGTGVDPATENRAGWVATVGNATLGYKLYAYDYLADTPGWYQIQDLSSTAVEPEYSVLLSGVGNNGNPSDVSGSNSLNINGLWFVET